MTPTEALEQLAESNRIIHEGEIALFNAVLISREVGCTWEEIGAELGVSKQAAHERFAALTWADAR